MKKTFSSICFDMDGVLIESRAVVERAWTSVANAYGVAIDDATMHEHVHGRPGRYTLDRLFSAFSEDERALIKRQVDSVEETASSPLLHGARALLDALHDARVPCALVTSSWPARIEFVLAQHRLQNFFQVLVSREDVAAGKPSPLCYQLAAKRLGVAPDSCLVFEDSRSGVIAAVASGAHCVGLGDDPHLKQLGALAQYPDFTALSTLFVSNQSATLHCLDADENRAVLELVR